MEMYFSTPSNSQKISMFGKFTNFFLTSLYNLLPVYGGCGDEKEDSVEEHHHHAGQVEVHTDRLVLEETLAQPHPGLHELHAVEDVETVGEDDGEGEEGAGAPAHQGVEEELQHGRTAPGDLGLSEGPAKINTHDRHPAQH